MRRGRENVVLCLNLFVLLKVVKGQTVGRWGQSAVILSPNNSPSLFIISGKSYVPGQTVNSNPTTSSSLLLPLASAFNLDSPPWVSISSGPTSAYGSALALSNTTILQFGGDATGDTSEAIQTAADSSWLLSIPTSILATSTASWIHQPLGWANQPTRRQNFFSASLISGTTSRVWVYGGITSDGSLLSNAELWTLEVQVDQSGAVEVGSSQGWFKSSGDGGPPRAYDGVAVLIRNTIGGQPTIYLIGGVQTITGVTSLAPLSSVWIYTPANDLAVGSWNQIITTNSPAPRRGHVAVDVGNGKIWIQGGRSLDGSIVFSDSAVLDLSTNSWKATSPGSQVFGHSAVMIGDTVITCLGYGQNQPALSSVSVYAPGNDTYLTSYHPSYALPLSSSITSSTPSTSSSTSSSLPSQSSHSSTSSSSTTSSAHSSSTGLSPTASPSESSHSNISAGVLAVSAIAGIIIALILLIGGIILYRRRQRRAISRAFPSPRSHHGWHNGEGSGSLMGENWRSNSHGEYVVEKTVPVGTRNVIGSSSVIGRLWRGNSKDNYGQRKGAAQARFDMLRDEESDKWDSLNGKEEWKTFSDGREDEYDSMNRSRTLWEEDNHQEAYRLPTDINRQDSATEAMLTPIQEYDEDFEDTPQRSNTFTSDSTNRRFSSREDHSYESSNLAPTSRSIGIPFGVALEPSVSRGQSLHGATFSHTIPNSITTQQLLPRSSLSSNDHGEVLTRSSTWWGRLQDIASKNNPSSAAERIRDPTPAPQGKSETDRRISGDTESPATALIPIVYFKPDEMGRLDEATRRLRKESSISSTTSANTASSSILEKRMRDMVVVERLRTGSASTSSFSPTFDSEDSGFDLPPTSIDDSHLAYLERDDEESIVWNGLLERGSGNISPSKKLRDPFADPDILSSPQKTTQALKEPRPLLDAILPISPIKSKGVKAMVQQLEAAEANVPSPSKSKRPKQDKSSSPRIGHELAKRENLFVANPDDE